MNAAIERIVVQTTPEEKRAIFERAKELDIPVSELMRRAASSYEPDDEELVALAEAAEASAKRSMLMLDDTLAYIAQSNTRIAAMEEQARLDRTLPVTKKPRRRKPI